MKKKIFIYGGFYKTASEFLAEKYFENLDKEKFEVFSTTGQRNKKFYHIFLQIIYGNLKVEEGKKQIFELLKNVTKSNIVILSTGYYAHRYTGHADFQKRFNVLEEIFSQPNYIIILRDQKTSIYSQWHAGLKKRVKMSFEDYTNGDEDFLKKQNLLNCKEITNYKMFDYNKILSPYIGLYNEKDNKRVIFLIYEELKKTPDIFFNKLNNFLNIKDLNFKIDFNYINKSNPLEETNLLCFLYFKKIHIIFLNFIYIFFKIFKFLGFKTNIKPPFKNYKFERTLNPFSMVYLKFIDKMIFKIFFRKKIENYKKNKVNRIKEIEIFYANKNKDLEKKLNIKLDKFNYF
jgi:hypothetical protein